jgi:hypothetical protein
MASATIAPTASQHDETKHRFGIYLAFIPWIVFGFGTEHSTLKLAASAALVIS